MNSVNPGFHWSSCSVEAIKTGVSNRLRSKCLTNIPDVGKSTKKVLPGTMVSRDDQCKRLLGFEAYSGGNVSMSQSCVKLTCIEFLTNGAIRYHTPSEPPAEGTVCGQGKICLDGECVQNPDPLQKKIPMPKLMTRNEHCKKFTGFEACTNGPREKSRDCKNLVCYDKVSNLIITSPEPPFEGSDCGFGEVCQNSICDVNPEILKGRVSPPKIKSREEQCQKLGASYHSYEDSSDCSELVCKIMGELEITTTKIHPEDGTDCGEGRICFAYKCISYSEKFGLRKSRV